MARVVGDKNLSLREKRKDTQIAALKAKLEAEKASKKVLAARNKELQQKLREKKKAK